MAKKEAEFKAKREALLAQLAELEKQEEEAKTEHFAKALEYLEVNGVNIDELLAYYKKTSAQIIFQLDYTDPASNSTKTFTRYGGQLGAIPNDVKKALRALGRDALVKGIKDEKAGAKVVESIFKDRSSRTTA